MCMCMLPIRGLQDLPVQADQDPVAEEAPVLIVPVPVRVPAPVPVREEAEPAVLAKIFIAPTLN